MTNLREDIRGYVSHFIAFPLKPADPTLACLICVDQMCYLLIGYRPQRGHVGDHSSGKSHRRVKISDLFCRHRQINRIIDPR